MEEPQANESSGHPHVEIEKASTVVESNGFFKIMPEALVTSNAEPAKMTLETNRAKYVFFASRPTGLRA